MQIEIFKSKIHRVSVTEADLKYIGSISIDEDLLDAANMIEGEKVQIVNINNGERIETYIIKGERGSGNVCLNGPAARRVAVGDVVIIISYARMDFEEAKTFKPTIVFPNPENNKIEGYLSWETNTSSRYIPPGSPIEYSYIIKTKSGKTFNTKPETIVYLDNNKTWI